MQFDKNVDTRNRILMQRKSFRRKKNEDENKNEQKNQRTKTKIM